MRLIQKYWFWFIILGFCLTPLIWFWGKGDVLINGLDTNFPLDPLVWFKRRFFVWNDVINAGSDFSAGTAGLFFHFIQVVPYLLGFSLKGVEIFSLIFWFSAVVLSAFLLARVVIPRSRIAQIIFVAIYAFNTYLFNTWENIKVANLSLIVSLPIFVWIIDRWSQKALSGKRAFLYLCFASILASGAGINPAYFSVIVLAIIIQGIIFRKIKIPLISLLTLFLINLFWLLPLLNFLLTNRTKGLEDLGLTNWLESLSENTSITNVVRLQGAWDWYALDKYGMPQYLPYTLNYLYKWPFIIFSFVVPVLAFASFLFLKPPKKHWYLFFGTLALFGIFWGVGAHEPTGKILLFLYQHVPFLSFFRSPWYIFTPLLILSYAGLVAMLWENFSGKFRWSAFAAFIFLVAYGLYNYPLVTGKIFRPDKDGFYIKFPLYVYEAKRWLAENTKNENRRIISYPDDDLERFNWGYKGTDSILGLFSEQEVVAPSFNLPSKNFTSLLQDFYSHLKRGEYESALSVARFFAADTIFYKKDSPTLSPSIADKMEDLVSEIKFGDWAFMKVNAPVLAKIYSPAVIYNNLSSPAGKVLAAPLLEPSAAVVNATVDSQITQIPNSESYLSLVQAEVDTVSNNQKHYKFTLPKNGVFDLAIEKRYVDKNAITIRLDEVDIDPSLINETDGYLTISSLRLKKGEHLLTVTFPEPPNLLDVRDFSSFAEGINLRKEELPENPAKTLVAVNLTDKERLIRLPVAGFNPFVRYEVGFDYKYVYGSVPIVDIIQSAPSAPVKTHPIYPGGSMDWETKREIYEPVETDSKLELLIRMPANKLGDRSKAYFENIFIKRVYDNQVFIIENSAGLKEVKTVEFRKISPVKYEVKARGGMFLVFLENYNQGWVLKPKEKILGFKPLHFTVNGYANGWYLPGDDKEEKEYLIYYAPQRLFILGASLSAITFISATAYLFLKWKRH